MKIKKIKRVLIACILYLAALLIASSNINAQDQENNDDKKKLSFSIGDGKQAVFFKFGGYVDTYYSYNLSKGDLGHRETQNEKRIFDTAHNAFTLGLVQTKFDIGNDNWEVVLDLVHGPNAELGNFGNVSGENSITSTAIKQAYASVTLFGVKLTAGQYNTHIGYEVIEAYLNSNYSLSNLFGYGPFYHLGLKLDYTIIKGLDVMVGVVNGWDADENTDINAQKSVIAQIGIGMVDGLDLYLNYIGGDESDQEGGWRNLFDLTTSYSINDFFKIGLNAAIGNESVSEGVNSEIWYGAALYFDYLINPGQRHTYMLSLRGEYFDDMNGVRGFGPANTIGVTVTGTIGLYHKAFQIKPEFRYDRSNEGIYVNGRTDQITVLIAFIGAI